MKDARRAAVRVRRSPHLVFYWRGKQLIGRNYATGTVAAVPPVVCDLLHYCTDWTTIADIQRVLLFPAPAGLVKIIRQLVARSFLHQAGRPQDPRERAMSALDAWNPEAGFFHTATRSVRFWPPQEAARRARVRARESAMPAPVKGYAGVPVIILPAPTGEGDLGRVVRERRTWRRFSSTPVTLQELATLLGLSLGVQKWVSVGGRDLPLKTSPSGGARHPVEGYVIVRKVRGLQPGIYHYHAGRHVLARLGRAPTARRLGAYMPNSGYFARASAVVFLTAVLERQLWRYPYSRAYRAALIEAGHVCQTFCLAATGLGLAPFSLMGLADAVIERDLGLDGITEPVLYAAGVGGRPPRSTWAPRARGTLPVRPNKRLG